jgi:hypothetical protein
MKGISKLIMVTAVLTCGVAAPVGAEEKTQGKGQQQSPPTMLQDFNRIGTEAGRGISKSLGLPPAADDPEAKRSRSSPKKEEKK